MKLPIPIRAGLLAVLVGGLLGLFVLVRPVRAQAAATDPFVQCVKGFTAEAHYASIAAKLPLADINSISFGMLADQSKPTPQERQDIAEWFDRRDACWKSTAEYHAEAWPPEFIQVADESTAALKAIGVDLYNRRISYGEANRQIQDVGNSTKAKVAILVKQFQADAVGQQARAAELVEKRRDSEDRKLAEDLRFSNAVAEREEAARQQRTQMWLNYMRSIQPAPIQMPPLQIPPVPHTYNTLCTGNGNMVNCTTN
jgi:hypothetical protein